MSLQKYCNTLDSKYDVYTASRHIDLLTNNKILIIGWNNLSDYQREIVSLVCEHQAIFEYENKDVFNSPVKSYSLNGASVNLEINTDTFYAEAGVIISKADYELLKTTGLCSAFI